MPALRKPEILAPAGDRACLEAAVRAGADAVYFGLPGFNARARATNFGRDELASALAFLHEHGRKGYVTLNTLCFDDELPALEEAVRCCAEAGVDAVIVQDLGVARLVRTVAPTLPIHASTQMTCTDAASVELARSLGAERVILARELSLDDIAAIRATSDAELEVFVHGALCISYSGQCLTSEAIGGRSANRGACAQACRLPYELVVDGEHRPLGDRAFLLSPEDLEASALVPRLIELGVSSLKIEGRLKGPEYVGATTALYRRAVDAACASDGDTAGPDVTAREVALQMFTRGSGPGFLAGVDHQRLVEARACDHRGLALGTFAGTRAAGGRTLVGVTLSRGVARGDGILIEGAFGGEGELGGRVWAITDAHGADVKDLESGTAWIWLGPDVRVSEPPAGRRVFLTSSPAIEREARALASQEPRRRAIDVRVSGAMGEPFFIEARTEDGFEVRVVGDANVSTATGQGIDEALVRDKIGQLGDTPFVLRDVALDLPPLAFVPPSAMKRARRALTQALLAPAIRRHDVTDTDAASLIESSRNIDRAPPPKGLFVLCRNEAQADAALAAGADGVYLDFLELTGTGAAFRTLRAKHPHAVLGVAPPRIRKPKEEKIDQYLASLAPDVLLVRGLGALHELASARANATAVADFSLNATNSLTARDLLARGASAFVPSFDLDAAQLVHLLSSPLGAFAEVVLHHPMPLFHMEHCVIAALLSDGKDFKTCGRPCERHQLSLRDRAGMEHPVEADVGCRNTVFHARAQSAADVVPQLLARNVGRYRIELVRESAEDVTRIVGAYRKLLAGDADAPETWRALRTESGYGVVRGSLRVLQA